MGGEWWFSLAVLSINVSLFKKCCLINAPDGTECNNLLVNSDLECPELRGGLEEVDLEFDTVHMSEEDDE